MTVFFNLLKLLVFLSIFSIDNVKAYNSEFDNENIEFLEEGVLKKDDLCNIIYTNFGAKQHILDITYEKEDNEDGTFNLIIKKLVNGNMGPNQVNYLNPDDLENLILIEQNGVEITNKSISNVSGSTGLMTLKINNLSDCNNLKIKQTFKEDAKVATRLYYVNEIPKSINQAFDSRKFGPPLNQPFKRLHWDLNAGLDDLRKTCGIYIYYTVPKKDPEGKNHWQYYLSIDSVNTKNCTNEEFYNVIKRNFREEQEEGTQNIIDQQIINSIVSNPNFQAYVLKREGHVEEHMDGVIVGTEYLIEVKQKNCNENNEENTICTMQDKLTFTEFAQQLVECLDSLSLISKDDQESDWEINESVAIAKFKGQYVKVSNSDNGSKGSLPNNVDEYINYSKVSGEDSKSLARFMITFTCDDSFYINEKCICEGIYCISFHKIFF